MHAVAAVVLFSSVLAMPSRPVYGAGPPFSVLLTNLPEFYDGRGYKVDPYIKAAIALQGVDPQTRAQALLDFAKDEKHGRNAIILCRMLFSQKPDREFRRARIGTPDFLGGTNYPDWPLEPIRLVFGVPFLVTRGYHPRGVPEPAESYVRYCLTNCEWTALHFAPKTAKQKEDSLATLIASPRWHGVLTAPELAFLTDQIQPPTSQLPSPQEGTNRK